MTREEAIADIKHAVNWAKENGERWCGVEVGSLELALEALKEPKARCSNCDFLKSCMHAWDIDCGCEFYKVDGVRQREEEQ